MAPGKHITYAKLSYSRVVGITATPCATLTITQSSHHQNRCVIGISSSRQCEFVYFQKMSQTAIAIVCLVSIQRFLCIIKQSKKLRNLSRISLRIFFSRRFILSVYTPKCNICLVTSGVHFYYKLCAIVISYSAQPLQI